MKRKFVLALIDVLLVAVAFLLMAWMKPATKAVILPFYFKPFLIFLGVWLIASILTGKYLLENQYKLKDSMVIILIGNATVTAIVTTLITFFRLFAYSRMIVFGTIIMATVFEVIVALIYNSILNANRIDSSDRFERMLLQGKKRDKSIIPERVIREFEDQYENGAIEIPQKVADLISREYGELVLDYIMRHATPDVGMKNIISTSSRFNILALPQGTYSCLINLHRINDVQRINKFFEAVNDKLPDGGIFIGKVETNSLHKVRILRKYFFPLNYLIYTVDFIFKRVFPKVPGLHKIYFGITKGRNRLLSRAETLGRLYSCGFEVLDEQLVKNELFFMARKTGEPFYPPHPTYGPLVRLNRVGKNGKVFGVYKMRTMHPYSEYLQEYVYKKYNLQEGGKFKNDFRISTLGRFMRKIWLDELPMFINVVKGDMKIVGVRPLSKHYFSLYNDELKEKRIKVKPGLIPPYYADMPKTLDEIMKSELRYLEAYEKHPLLTDIKYFFKAWENIIFKKARSN
jgi:lipopolysaccharide/colanic/teichoic acid biosynthesis glycosyltransferase